MVVSLDRWIGKVAIVTGASSGIGETIAEILVENGIHVVGLARRNEIIEENAKKLSGKKGKLYALKADIGKEEDILKAFEWTKKNVGPVAILVNNSAHFVTQTLIDGKSDDWRCSYDVNVIGLTIAAREAIKVMRENNIDGQIININSVAGHKFLAFTGVYGTTKHAVTSVTETLRLELNSLKSKIKITSLSPGVVDTAGLRRVEGEGKNRVFGPRIETGDIADAVVYVLSTPPHVQIQELIIRPVGEDF